MKDYENKHFLLQNNIQTDSVEVSVQDHGGGFYYGSESDEF